jgi:hypothetical protein
MKPKYLFPLIAIALMAMGCAFQTDPSPDADFGERIWCICCAACFLGCLTGVIPAAVVTLIWLAACSIFSSNKKRKNVYPNMHLTDEPLKPEDRRQALLDDLENGPENKET